MMNANNDDEYADDMSPYKKITCEDAIAWLNFAVQAGPDDAERLATTLVAKILILHNVCDREDLRRHLQDFANNVVSTLVGYNTAMKAISELEDIVSANNTNTKN